MNKILIAAILILVGTSQTKANMYDLRTSPPSKNCHTLTTSRQGEPGMRLLQCEQKAQGQELNRSFFIIKTQFQHLPNFVKGQFQNHDVKIEDWDQVYFSLSTENDDLVLFGLCKVRDTSCSDDLGYTVGSAISLGGVYQNKTDVQMKLANALYSKSVPGSFKYDAEKNERHGEQNIRTALLLEFLINSARQENLYYWSLGTGMIGLSSEESFGFLDAAQNQRTVHTLLNKIGSNIAVTRTNVNDGQKDQWGFYLLAGIGVQKLLRLDTANVTSRTYAQITTRMSTLEKHSELRLELGTEAGKRIGSKSRMSAGGNVAATLHSDGSLRQATVYIKYETGEKIETSLAFTCQKGTLANFASYNIPNIITGKPECLYKISMKYYLD